MKTQSLKFSKRIKPALRTQIEKSYQKLLRLRKRERDASDSKMNKDLKDLNTLSKSVVGKNELKLYEQLRSQHKLACENERLKFLGKQNDESRIINKHKSALTKDLEKKIPGLKKLAKKRQRVFSGFLKTERNNSSFAFGSISGIAAGLLERLEGLIFLDPTAVSNKPPYSFNENRIDIIHDQFNSLEYDSIADVDTGFIIHDISSYHEDNAWFTHKAAVYEARAGFGVNYRMPKTGTVSVDVLIQSLHNKNFVSITDNSGLSEGYADLENKLYLDILHPNNIALFEIGLNEIHISTGGDDIVRTDLNKIDTEFAKWINFRSTGVFAEGTDLQVIVGNKETLYNILDDMQCRTETLYSWFVRNIIVRTV